MFSPQIHITFNCEEEERITKPIIENPPNKLYIFIAFIKKSQEKDINMHFYEKNIKLLKEKIPLLEIITKEVDYTDYIEIIQELSKIIKSEREENANCKIFINVSTGSKMASLASAEASKLWNCELYYVHSSKYDPHGGGPRHKGEFYIFKPITFPIEKPKKTFIRTLKLIENLITRKYQDKIYDQTKEKFVYMKYLIQELEENGYIELDSKHKEPSSLKSALYMKSRNFLEPLVNELKYIKISDDKRNKKVYLAPIGKDILEIFKFLI
ncbi:MAG: DUF6293 family protein [Candidatus Thorarchaeota archaeon]